MGKMFGNGIDKVVKNRVRKQRPPLPEVQKQILCKRLRQLCTIKLKNAFRDLNDNSVSY